MTNWFVLWVLTGKEKEVLARVKNVADVSQALVPEEVLYYRKDGGWEERPHVLIPGYVFLQCKMDSAIYYQIRGIPHVIGWLGSDSMWPTIVPEDEMIPVLKIHAGCDPAGQLQEVTIDKRKRRGKGTLMLYGKPQTITFTPRTTEQKQPEEAQVDQSPAADESEQRPEEQPQG